MNNKKVDPKISEYFSKLGKKGGEKLLKTRGRDYYKKIAAMRKTHGRQKKVSPSFDNS